MTARPEIPMQGQEFWRKVLTEGHRPVVKARHRLFRGLPGPPRCKSCYIPFGGLGGRLAGLIGYQPSRKNPNLGAVCCERLPPGGAEVDIAVLFADLRGSTSLGERLGPGAFAGVLNGFYRAATEVLVAHDAIIDKLIGDEVMALFIRGICGPDYHRHAAEAAFALAETLASGLGLPFGTAVLRVRDLVVAIGCDDTIPFQSAAGFIAGRTLRQLVEVSLRHILHCHAIRIEP
jgi:adenylate cyclase